MRRSAAPSQKGPAPKKALFVPPFFSTKANSDVTTVSNNAVYIFWCHHLDAIYIFVCMHAQISVMLILLIAKFQLNEYENWKHSFDTLKNCIKSITD